MHFTPVTPDSQHLLNPRTSKFNMAYGLSRVVTDLKQYGARQVAHDVALRTVNRVVFFRLLRCLKLDMVNPEFLIPPDEYTAKFVSHDELREFAKHREWELSPHFLDEAFGKGDQCYAFFREDKLAAYQWYATGPTETAWYGLVAHFSDQHVYMYKGFTHPEHRGHRLYPTGVTTALSHYKAKGYKSILSLVESNNFASLRSCYRMGYIDLGRIRITGLLSRCLLRSDPGCLVQLMLPEQRDAESSMRGNPLLDPQAK